MNLKSQFFLIVLSLVFNLRIASACSPCQALSGITQTLVGTNLTLTFTSNAGWACCYTADVEIVCANANFTGVYNYQSPQNCLTNGSTTNVPYQPFTIDLSSYCPGDYKWRAVETMGCGIYTATYYFTIVGSSPIIPTASASDTEICPNQPSQLSASGTGGCNGLGNYIYSWSPAAGLSNPNIANPVATPGVTTNYTVTLSEAGSCASPQSTSVLINVTPFPTGTITGATSVCRDAPEPTLTFTGASSNAPYVFTYNVNGGPNQTVTSVGNVATITAPTSVSGPFNYTLISVLESSPQACSQLQLNTITVNVIPPLEATISGDASVCLNGPGPVVTFTGSGGVAPYTFTYNVDGGPDQTVVSNGGNTATINAATNTLGTSTYNLLFAEATGPTSCEADQTGFVEITITELPISQISPMVEVCRNDPQPTFTFTGTNGTAPFEFTYTINGGVPFTISTAPGDNSVAILAPTNIAGTYDFVITNVNTPNSIGCSQAQNELSSLLVHELPSVDAGNDITRCFGETVILYGSGAGFGANYSWDNGIFDLVGFIPSDTTTYTVTGVDINGCINTDQVTVNVSPFPVINFVGNNLYGCQPLVSTFDNLSTGNIASCHWSFSNGETFDICGPVEVTFNDPGCWNATLTAESPEGCVSTMTLLNYACVEPNPVAEFFPDPPNLTIYDSESQMLNSSTGAVSYEWSFEDGIETSTEFSPVHEFPNEQEGAYWIQLVATSDAGCVDTARQAVIVIEDVVIYVPNTFTPNSDPLNNEFKPVIDAGVDLQSYTLYIFDRWGELIFESHDSNIGWNGLYGVGGNLANTGTYNWHIECKRRMDGSLMKFNGYVNLLK